MNYSTNRLTESPKVSLGCGTLILIALIVLIFGGGNNQASSRELRATKDEMIALRGEVRALRQTVEQQNQRILELLLKQQAAAGPERVQ